MAGTALRYQESHTVCSGDGVFGLLAAANRAAGKQFIAIRMGHVTKEKNKENNKYILSYSKFIHFPKIKQGGRSKSEKKEIRAEKKLKVNFTGTKFSLKQLFCRGPSGVSSLGNTPPSNNVAPFLT